MIAIVCGSREWTDVEAVRRVLASFQERRDLDTVIHGAQRGADNISGDVARSLGIAVIPVEADWEAYGSAAGPIRNDRMLKMLVRAATAWGQPVHCIAFHNDPRLGVGTKDMIYKCRRERIRTSAFVSPTPPMVRASPYAVCSACNHEYIRHPVLISELDSAGEPFLELSCSGMALKL